MLAIYYQIILKKALHIAFLIGLSTLTSFCQVLNDQCNGPNIGSGSLYAEKMIGCVPFTLRIIKTDTQSTGHKFIYDYKGGVPTNLVEGKSHTYTTPGAYKVLQSSFRKDNGQELRVCGIVTVLDTNKLILKPKTGAYKKVSSPIGIARMLPETWDWEYIWSFTALFSIGLAFMNCLPIPGLDGGHALFTIVEMITGKTLSEKAMGNVQTGGMIFLLSLMALTFGKDIYQLVLDKLM